MHIVQKPIIADSLNTFFTRKRGLFLLTILEKVKNMPSLSRKAKSQIFNLSTKTNICNLFSEQKQQQVPHTIINKGHFAS